MINRVFCFFILLNTLTVTTARAQANGWPIIRNYTPNEYGGEPQVFSVLHDKNSGIMHFGIEPGILSFDGVRWTETPTANKTVARSLCQSPDGTVYVAADDDFGFLAYDALGKPYYKSLAHLIPDTSIKIGPVWSVKVVKDEVIFQTYDNIFRYLPSENKIVLYNATPNGWFLGVFVHEDTYYIRMDGIGLMRIVNGKLTEAPHSGYFKEKDSFYKGAVPYNDGRVMIATQTKGLLLYNPNSKEPPVRLPIRNEKFLTENFIDCAYPLPKNRFALGSRKQGMLIIDGQGNTLQTFNEVDLLQNNGILDIVGDRSGHLWLDMGIGLSKTDQNLSIGYWDKNLGLKASVTAFTRFQSKLYAATGTKVFYFDEEYEPKEVNGIPVGQNWSFLSFTPPSMPNKSSMQGQGQTEILLAGTSSGIYQIKGTEAERIYEGSHAHILCQSQKNQNRLFSEDQRHIISLLFENGKWKHEAKWEGLHEQLHGIVEDIDGTLWIGSYSKGIIKAVPDFNKIGNFSEIRYYNEKDGLPTLKKCKPFWFQNRIVWGTEKGLYVRNPQNDRFEPFCGLGTQFCDGTRGVYQLQVRNDGRVYISPESNKWQDMGWLEPDGKGGYKWVFAPFRRMPRMARINVLYAEENGLVWLGSNEGLYRYDESEDDRDYGIAFGCLVRKVLANGDSAVYYGGSPVPGAGFPKPDRQVHEYKNSSLRFLYAAPFFDSEEKTLYSYKLDGYDETWSEWDRHSEKEYNHLFEGEYVFMVKAKNIYEVESSTDSYAFEIRPPFYRAWWAFVLYSFALGACTWALINWKSRRLEAEKKRLEAVVVQRTLEIASKNNELKQSNEEIRQQSEEIALQHIELQTSYEYVRHISEIGREITRYINVEAIIDTVYFEVKKLMPADSFGIGVYNEKENRIDFPASIEKGKKFPLYWNVLDHKDSLSDICFMEQMEIMINDLDLEITRYLPKSKVLAGEKPESVIYMPLIASGKTVGNITVQCFQKNAYTHNHIDLFRNIALYAAIALENASAYLKLEEEKKKVETEKEKSENLLLNILPKETAEELKETGQATTKHYEKVSVLFTDFKGFTQISERMSPEEVVKNLDYCFRAFDEICKRYRLEKIKTIGDAYMAAGGIPLADDDNVERTVAAAIEIRDFILQWKKEKEEKGEKAWEVRIGIHTGPVVAGVVGKDKFAYDIWGDTVNMASRMESSGETGRVNISETVHTHLLAVHSLNKSKNPESSPIWRFEFRGMIKAKNKGEVRMYFVENASAQV